MMMIMVMILPKAKITKTAKLTKHNSNLSLKKTSKSDGCANNLRSKNKQPKRCLTTDRSDCEHSMEIM